MNPQLKALSVNIYLSKSSRLETNKVWYLYNNLHIYHIFICLYLFLVYVLNVCRV